MDEHGFPIVGVAAFDAEEGGVVSPGGVGFDINCGVRLLFSDLGREEVDPGGGRMVDDPQKNRLADALYEGVPSGVGKGRKDTGFGREDLEEVLVEGAGALVGRGYGEGEDLVGAIGLWYEDFYQVPDEEVVGLLERAIREQDERGATGPEGRR